MAEQQTSQIKMAGQQQDVEAKRIQSAMDIEAQREKAAIDRQRMLDQLEIERMKAMNTMQIERDKCECNLEDMRNKSALTIELKANEARAEGERENLSNGTTIKVEAEQAMVERVNELSNEIARIAAEMTAPRVITVKRENGIVVGAVSEVRK